MRVVERPFSEFLRQPNDVIEQLADHDVVLRRRNAPALRLSDADRDNKRDEVFVAMAQILRNLLAHNPVAQDVVNDVFPWATFLPQQDHEAFVHELTQTLVAAALIDNLTPLGQLLQEWKATAEIYADPSLARRLRDRLDADGDTVPAPLLDDD